LFRVSLKETGASYTTSQVQGALNKLEPTPDIVGDTAKIYDKVKAKMVSLVGDGGSLDKLIQARKDFDSYIQRSFPNLYDSDRLSGIKKPSSIFEARLMMLSNHVYQMANYQTEQVLKTH
jgi:hypothetical protein